MKKSILIFIVSFLSTGWVNGQETSNHFSKNNIIKINPIGFGSATFQISYERFLNERKYSVLIAPAVILKETNEESKSGWEIMAQYRFYLTHFRKDKQKTFLGVYNYGFYTGLYALYFNYDEDFRMASWDEERNEYKFQEFHKDITAVEGGALIGIQIDITKRIVIDFYVGGGVKQAEVKDTYLDNIETPEYYESYDVFDPEYKGVKPKMGLLLGITF